MSLVGHNRPRLGQVLDECQQYGSLSSAHTQHSSAHQTFGRIHTVCSGKEPDLALIVLS